MLAVDGTREITRRVAHATCFWTLASRTVWLLTSLKEQNLLCMARSGNPAVR
jgi:hypothetical protein